MESVRKLQELIAKVDYDHNIPSQDRQEIYQFIEQEVLSPHSPIIKQIPPLHVITYAIHTIIRPRLDNRQMPRLLDLLATVEFYRKRALDRVNEAIGWNDFYKMEKSFITFSEEEEAYLKGLQTKDGQLRKIYVRILAACCELDMYLLWTATPPSMTDFFVRFNEYFPFMSEHCGKSPRLCHTDLQEADLDPLKDVALRICDFAQQTVKWATNHTSEGQLLYDTFRTDAFKIAFPEPVGERLDGITLSELITYFVDLVTSAAQKVDQMFAEPEQDVAED